MTILSYPVMDFEYSLLPGFDYEEIWWKSQWMCISPGRNSNRLSKSTHRAVSPGRWTEVQDSQILVNGLNECSPMPSGFCVRRSLSERTWWFSTDSAPGWFATSYKIREVGYLKLGAGFQDWSNDEMVRFKSQHQSSRHCQRLTLAVPNLILDPAYGITCRSVFAFLKLPATNYEFAVMDTDPRQYLIRLPEHVYYDTE